MQRMQPTVVNSEGDRVAAHPLGEQLATGDHAVLSRPERRDHPIR
jgi:hypothetical protein